MQKITLVKKILADGSSCRKCKDVMDRLERDNYINGIDRIAIADERFQDSEGMVLAQTPWCRLRAIFYRRSP